MVTARASGRRVEDLSQRTESTQVFANPDGTWTAEEATGPVRVQDDAEAWHDIDTTLVERDGVFAPKYAATDVRLSDGGDKVFAQVTEDGKDLAWHWPTDLPVPQIEGSTATYVDAVPGGDLVVTATPTGFSHSIVLRERPDSLDAVATAAEPSSSPTATTTATPSTDPTSAPTTDPSPTADPSATGSDAVQYSMPLSTDGAKLTETPQGGLTVATTSGEMVATAPQPLMWDSTLDAAGDPANVAQVEATVTAPGQTTPEGETAGSTPVVTLTPDQDFLADPDTVYPVTIDPSFTTNSNGDTWIENADYTTSQSGSDELRAGTFDSGAHIARSYLTFNQAAISDKHITKATLWMRNWYSQTCSGANINATRIIDSWSVSALTWANRPNYTTTDQGVFSTAYGGSTCPANGAHWDVTKIVDGWANGTFSNYGLQIRANTETANAAWRRYRSINYTDPTVAPRLVVTYNRAPNTPTQPTANAVGTYAAHDTDPVQTYVQDTTPTFSTTVSDVDGGTVQARFEVSTTQGGAAVSSCLSPVVGTGLKASCAPTTSLTDGGTYWVRSTGWDGNDYTGGTRTLTTGTKWSASMPFTVAASTPSAPVVSCPTPYTDGSWTTTAPGASVTCTVTAAGTGTSAPGYINVAVDRQNTPTRVRIVQSSDPNTAQTTVTIPTTEGDHGVSATAESPSGKLSATTDYGFGWGNMGMAAPAPDQAETTTDTVAIDASGPPSAGGVGTPTATVKWRVAGSGSDYDTGWNEDTNAGLTVTNDATAGVHVTGAWDTRHAETDNSSDSTPITLDPDRPVLLDVQVCVDYPGTRVPGNCTWSAGVRQVLRVAHAFGGNFPTTDVPGGHVALWTGEFATAASDATVGAPGADLSVSRTASSFAGPVPNPATQVFGPGWAASLDGPDGPDAGLGNLTLVDNTLLDGTLQLVDGVGDIVLFGASANPVRRTTATIDIGDWVALDEDTELSGTKMHVSGSGSSTVVAVTEDDGTVTNYTAQTAPTTNSAGVFTVASIDEAGTEGATTYGRDPAGRITRMLAPVPAGVTCPTTDPAYTDPATLAAGCRALTITYATTTTATSSTPGDVAGQTKSIAQVIGGSAQPTPLATYTYDDSQRLVSATDPRNNLTTTYAYDGTSDRIATVTPAGLKPINYAYAPTSHKLARITRERPATDPAGGTATISVVYDIPTHGHAGLPDLDQSTVAAWGQADAPAYGVAVFGSDQPLSSAGTSVSVADVDASASGGSAWADASLSYTDGDGREINTADNGAGGWQYTSSSYDDHDNPVRSLDERDIAAVKNGDLLSSQAGALTVYNTEVKDSGGAVILPAGSVVVDSYGTARWIRTEGGALAWARPHTHTDYDEGAPNSGINPATGLRYTLPTTVTVNAVDPSTNNVVDSYSEVTKDYSSAIGGDSEAGWNLGLAGTTTTVMAGSAGSTTTDITAQTRYDATGRLIETWQPKSDGTDAGTRKTYYYTAGTHPTVSACGNKPAWAGAVCQTSYAGSTPALVTTTIASYNDQLAPLSTADTAGSGTRTTTSTYRADGAATGSSVTASGVTGSTAIGATTLGYDSATGLPSTMTTAAAGGNPGGTITTGYDTWGRQITYTPTSGETTTTNYDASGEVSSVVDPKGTTSYTYDGTDAAGKSEHRGLVTKISITRPGTSAVEVTGAYDNSGSLTLQKLLGGITQRTTYDTAGEPTALSYSGPADIVDPDTGAVTGTNPDAPWLGWSQDKDALGRVRRDWTPLGAAFTGDTQAGASATGFARDYTYDRAARLVRVKDQTVPIANAGAGTTNPDDTTGLQALTACQYRDYALDANGNRTSMTRTTGAAGASCPTPGGTGAVTKTWAFDAGDRLATAPGGGSYVYDAFGRATTIPQADTPAASTGTPGAVTLGYYDDDSIKSLAQNGTTTTFGLDAARRRSTAITIPATGSSTTIERHYVDGSDNPGWTSTTTGTGSPVVERFAEALDGNLGMTITGTDVSLSISDLHGDLVTQIDVPASGAATGIASWSDTDEYGNPLDSSTTGKTPTNASGVTGGLGYGWLGSKQRATDGTGLMLMGARAYNPITGSFSSTDPVLGGNTSSYAYPQDPVNRVDLDGRENRINKAIRLAHEAAVCSSFGAYACGQIGTVSKIVNNRYGRYLSNRGNWVRHFVWLAMLTIYVGSSAAKAVAKSHEYRLNQTGTTAERADSNRDTYNNGQIFYILSEFSNVLHQYWRNSNGNSDFMTCIAGWARRLYASGWGQHSLIYDNGGTAGGSW
jgi:RHS repeat-associated protein